jgi:hypothetical protein
VSNDGDDNNNVQHKQQQGDVGGQGQGWTREEGRIYKEEEAKIAAQQSQE